MAGRIRLDPWWAALASACLALLVLLAAYGWAPAISQRVDASDAVVFRDFYRRESGDGMTFRWSGETGQIALPQVGRPALGRMAVDLWLPAERPARPLVISSHGRVLTVVEPPPGLSTLRLLVPPVVLDAGNVRLDLRGDPWQPPGETGPLGVAVRRVTWSGWGWMWPPLRQLWVVPDLAALVVLLLRRLRAAPGLAARQGILALAVMAVLYAPYWAGAQTLEVLGTAPPLRVMRGGLPAWLSFKLGERYCLPASTPGAAQPVPAATPQSERCVKAITSRVRSTSLALFFLVYAILVFWPTRSFGALVDRAVWVLVAYTLLAAINFRSWYLTWVIALVPLMRRPRVLLLWGCTIFLDYSRLPIWERNLLGFVPMLLLLGQIAVESGLQRVGLRAKRSALPASGGNPGDASPARRQNPLPRKTSSGVGAPPLHASHDVAVARMQRRAKGRALPTLAQYLQPRSAV